MSRVRYPSAVVPVLLLAAVACSRPADDAALAPQGANVVDVMAMDYSFNMPDTLPAGYTTFRLMSHGQEFHEVQLIRLEEGKTMADFVALTPTEDPPAWVVLYGGTAPPPMDGTPVESTLDLPAGRYLAVCFVPSPDGTPHMAKGMVKEFVVVPSDVQRTPPVADITLTMKDYTWEFSTPVTAGQHVIEVLNAGPHPHQTIMIRLNDGVTVEQFMAWVEAGMTGDPLGSPVGGVTVFGPGGGPNWFTHNFTAGTYALFCFITNPGEDQPHVALGMMMTFTI